MDGINVGSVVVKGRTRSSPILAELNIEDLKLFAKVYKISLQTVIISTANVAITNTFNVAITCNLLTQSGTTSRPNVFATEETVIDIFVLENLALGEKQLVQTHKHWFNINRPHSQLVLHLIDMDTNLPLNVKVNVKALFLFQ